MRRGRLRLAPLLAVSVLLAVALGACERGAGGGQSGPYIGVGSGLNRVTR